MKVDFSRTGISGDEFLESEKRLKKADLELREAKDGFTGWAELPIKYDRNEYNRLIKVADKIRKQCEAFIIIGVGGSYLGAKACIEMLSHSFYNSKERGKTRTPQIFFAGNNLSGTYHAELLEIVKDMEISICVISKSGTTTESNIGFALFKEILKEKYGENAKNHIYTITDKVNGTLREETAKEGYESFEIPDDIGGRYSVLTAGGLLPIAVAGIDITEILKGAESGKQEYDKPSITNDCWKYAAARRILNTKGKTVELYCFYEPKLFFLGEWLKQLFGESEGKEGKGIFPALVQLTADLHSMGQFVQEGTPILFETVINIKNPQKDILIPDSAAEALRGKMLNEVNSAAVQGVTEAHSQGEVPIITMNITEISPYYFGKLVYFFERAAALSGYMLNVNPFNQPGVEKYKTFMKEALQCKSSKQ